jgi:excisionase family DNA binding protein
LEKNEKENQRFLFMQIKTDELLTVAEIAAFLKVPNSWVYERTRLFGNQRLPHLRLGKYLRFSLPEVMVWLEKQRSI